MSLKSQGLSTPAVLPYLISSISYTTKNEGHTPHQKPIKASLWLILQIKVRKAKRKLCILGGFLWYFAKEAYQPECSSWTNIEPSYYTNFSNHLLSRSLIVVVVLFPTLRARHQHLREWDKPPGPEPVRITTETVFSVINLYRLRQPRREWRRVSGCSVRWRGSSGGHCSGCCSWKEGCFRC